MMRYLFLILSVILFSSAPGKAQKRKYFYSQLTSDQGLSHHHVTAIVQDTDGFLWFGTHDGLNRYDGKKFAIYRHDRNDPGSLPHNFVRKLMVDSKGRIWIGTQGGGLSMYDREKNYFVNYRHSDDDPNSLCHNTVRALAEDKKGNIWVGTMKGLDYLDTKTKKFTHYINDPLKESSLASNTIWTLKVDRSGVLWVGTIGGGLNRMEANGSFKRYKNNPLASTSLPGNDIVQIYEDTKNRLWIGVESKGLCLFDRKKEAFQRFQTDYDNPNSISSDAILAIEEDSEGRLWIGTENGGISIFNEGKGSFERHLVDHKKDSWINSNSVHEVFCDRDGNIWMGTFTGGINIVQSKPPKFEHLKRLHFDNTSLSHNNVLSACYIDKNTLLVGTDGGGLNELDLRKNRFSHHVTRHDDKKAIPSNYVLSILKDSDEEIWIGTFRGGFSKFNRATKSFYTYPIDGSKTGVQTNSISSIKESASKKILIGYFGAGFSIFDKKTGEFEHFKPDMKIAPELNFGNVYCLSEDSDGNLWIGTGGAGLYRFNPKTKKIIPFKPDKKIKGTISYNIINTVFEDSKKRVWVGTYNGLNLFDKKTQTFQTFYIDHGLPANAILGIQEDSKANLWISTSKGLSKFSLRKKLDFRNYGVGDGIQSNAFNRNATCTLGDGRMVFGGLNGFNLFHPDSIKEDNSFSKVFLTDFKIFNKTIVPGAADSILKKSLISTSEIALKYNQSSFSFDFVALNFLDTDQHLYAYKLDGFDKDWVFTTSGVATYTNISPGDYVFQVKAANSDGKWGQPFKLITIRVSPPFWQTWWFRIAAVIICITIAYKTYQWRIKSIELQKAELETQVQHRTEEVVAQAEALKRQSDDLAELNDELQEKRLEAEAAKTRADVANEAKSVFLATMSHEIRTPMNGILGMASLLSHTPLSAEQKEYLGIISSSGDALLGVINDILDFSKIESGMMEIENHEFQFAECIEGVLDVFATKVNEKGINLLYRVEGDIPMTLIGDGLRLRQVLINLVGNALKFTHQGEVQVLVSVEKDAGENISLQFDVKDSGIGIPENKMSKLFTAFSQVDASTTREYGGTGLGLTISQKLVTLMGGNIWVNSVEGEGSTFSFTILVGKPASLSQNYSITTFDYEEVLIADANQSVLNAIGDQLTKWKLKATVAPSGEKALEFLKARNFKVLIYDRGLSDIDFDIFMSELKTNHPDTALILLSHLGDQSLKGYSKSYAGLIYKPIKYTQLYNCIYGLLGKEENSATLNTGQPRPLSPDFAKEYPLNILIAEDNLINQKLAVRVLGKLGYDPVVAVNGQDAVEKNEEQNFDLVLMDVQMPVMDGFEATRVIKNSVKNQPIIIAMTANATPEDRLTCLRAGMDDYLSKPFKIDALQDKLVEVHQRKLVN